MDLILWRHAEAIDLDLVGDDVLRSLTGEGERRAARMAAWLDRQLPDGREAPRQARQPAPRQTARSALQRKYKTHSSLGAAQQCG